MIAIADVSATQIGGTFDDGMDVDEEVDHIPDGTEPGDTPVLSREEERSLVKDSTASFAGSCFPSSTYQTTEPAHRLGSDAFQTGVLPV